ncbi:MAG: HD domain-containing protein [Anaerolineae bacterium]|nr:HD domain-containing protein [Anaerolineae bacterium]
MSWREVVRQAAYDAAQAEAEAMQPRQGGMNYRWEHVQAVVRLALWLAQATGADAEVVEAAAWLHDVAKLRRHHAQAGAEAARRILPTTDFPADKIERVAEAIAQHEGLFRDSVLEPLEAAVLWDADKLTKIGAIGQLHARASGAALRPTTEETLTQDAHWLDIARRIARSMNTRLGLAEAARRVVTLENFHAALERELALGNSVILSESQRHEDTKGKQ